jgi:elongation factor G
VGDVINNLNSRRAEISQMDLQGDIQVISGKAALREMFGYSNDLRCLSQGRATYTMEPLQYAPVPEDTQKKLLNTSLD